MLIQELLPLCGATTAVVEIGDGKLRELLRVPDDVPHRLFETATPVTDGTTVVAFLGPDPGMQVAADAVAPALRLLPVGGRVVLLLGWPIEELPYHQVLGALVEADCQVLQVVPLDKARRHGAYCAVVAARVDRLAPPRGYLDDTPIALPGEEPTLRTLLRLAGEHAFGDAVARPVRRGLAEARDRNAELARRIRQLEGELQTRDERITAVQQDLAAAREDTARLRASTTYQVGSALVQGARRPTRAIVSVPAGLARVWRHRTHGRQDRTR